MIIRRLYNFFVGVCIFASCCWGFSTLYLGIRKREYNVAGQKSKVLFANNNNRDDDKGYKFGDFTRSIMNKGKQRKEKNKEKEEYQFGDITKSFVKKSVKDFTGKDEYEFGDLSRTLDIKSKGMVSNYTGKEFYKVGDISKEILKRASSGDYKFEDIMLLCKILLTVGMEVFVPVANFLPAKVLFQIINFSLAEEVGGKLVDTVALTLDRRFKEAITGDADYKLGDYTKRSMLQFMGKETEDQYEFGDLSKAILSKVNDDNNKRDNNSTSTSRGIGMADASSQGKNNDVTLLDPQLLSELEDWDLSLNLKNATDFNTTRLVE